MSEPLIKAAKKAYKESKVAEYDRLIAEERRWRRKATIAANKLAEVREDINAFAFELAKGTIHEQS